MVPHDGSTAAVIEALRAGSRTTGELAAAAGLTRNGVNCAVRRANAAGYNIVNVRRAGDRRGAHYLLLIDAEHPHRRFCALCGRRLSDSNFTEYCRFHLPLVALIAALELEVEDLLADPQPVQLDLLAGGLT